MSELRHVALFYRGRDDYLASVAGLVHGALDRGEPVFAALPGPQAAMLRGALGAGTGGVMFGDMARIGRNPARIIPALRAFIDRHPGERACCLGEPAWPGRADRELREAARQEALVNQALAGVSATIVCPYDLAGLPAEVLADAELTHPVLTRRGACLPSGAYLGPGAVPPRCDEPLARPPPRALTHHYRADLHVVRGLVAAGAERAGLPADRVLDLVLAASEVAANTLRHTLSGGTVHVWHTEAEILCQIDDDGWISDPLAGLVRQADGEAGGQGLWLVNQVCDLVELRTGSAGTTVRMHMRLP
ncbi:MAG TPA: sensor histidine kinase [Streptosporangiaceae bacterium]|nr:sensor histidine kinase [Streptosporangiaceae bacterium]